MAVGLKVDFLWHPIGTDDFVHAFFSTICLNLEKEDWGSRFPYLMNELYQGELKCSNASKATDELKTIQKELKNLSPKHVVWDIDDTSKQPPWGTGISPEITDLSNYFVTCDGEDLIEEIFKALCESKAEKQNIVLKSL